MRTRGPRIYRRLGLALGAGLAWLVRNRAVPSTCRSRPSLRSPAGWLRLGCRGTAASPPDSSSASARSSVPWASWPTDLEGSGRRRPPRTASSGVADPGRQRARPGTPEPALDSMVGKSQGMADAYETARRTCHGHRRGPGFGRAGRAARASSSTERPARPAPPHSRLPARCRRSRAEPPTRPGWPLRRRPTSRT